MKRYWQKKPLLVRQALPGFQPLLPRAELLALAERDEVESRCVQKMEVKTGRAKKDAGWQVRSGPFARRQLPALKTPDWTLLVQGVDLHHDGARQLLQQFRFLPDARLDDLMISFATDGGGVGPHYDSYDVFLLQAQGTREWRIGRQKDLSLREDTPLKVLANFEPEETFLLEPGDMLYLPPRYAHDGIARGECMTYSIGFRAPRQHELAQGLLQRLAEQAEAALELETLGTSDTTLSGSLYSDPQQPALSTPAQVPTGLQQFAAKALARWLGDPKVLALALGEWLTEPKPRVWFEAPEEEPELAHLQGGVVLDRRSKVLYDEWHFFINGEGFRAGGKDAKIMRCLADQGNLSAKELKSLSPVALDLVLEWCDSGWLRAC
jgi:50S ribosomal protein L16 3-hydroxylase